MKKILIVDNNKMLCKLLAKKISSFFDFEVELAYDFAEAQTKIGQGLGEYFLSFVDLYLPDAPNGEIVDFMLSHEQHIIVLTGNDDAKLKQQIVDKDIVAYIHKESPTCIEQIINSIDLITKFEKSKVILASSKLNERNEIKKLLNLRLFNVLAAAHGEEALSYLEDNNDVKLIICDAQMPVVDGLNLLIQVREKYNKNDLGVIILNEQDQALESTLLRNNANEVIAKPYIKELFNSRLNKCLKYLDDFKLMSILSDLEPLTGAKNSAALEDEIQDYLRDIKDKPENFAFAFLDIDNLKGINEEYGYSVGDKVIQAVVRETLNETKGRDIVGHYSSEKICILLKNITQEKAIKTFSYIRVNIKSASILVNIDELFFTTSIGITFGNNTSKLSELIARAEEALNKAKIEGKDRLELCF